MSTPKKRKDTSDTKSEETTAAGAAKGSQESKGPLKRFTQEDVSAAVWSRTIVKTEPVTYYSISLQRSYQIPGGEWKHTDFYNLGDKKKIDAVWEQAESYIDTLRQQEAA